jgi:hypothetical protein
MSLREGDCAVPRTWQRLPCPLLCPGTRPGMGALACPGMLMRRAEAVGRRGWRVGGRRGRRRVESSRC